MKYLALVFALLLSSPAYSAPQGFAWDYGSVTGLTGFKLYCGTVTKVYAAAPVATVTAANKLATVDFPAGSTNYCVVRAYNAVSESANSNELAFAMPPDAPTNFRITLMLTVNPDGSIRVKVRSVEEIIGLR